MLLLSSFNSKLFNLQYNNPKQPIKPIKCHNHQKNQSDAHVELYRRSLNKCSEYEYELNKLKNCEMRAVNVKSGKNGWRTRLARCASHH